MGDSDDENFVTFGEPLEPLDEENLPRKKPVTIEEQVVTDAQGRRRFHGAFTGGFSAGYFNTVGTRDGWRPQQFKSSRSNKAGSVNQQPQDFMDEEDTGEFGIAPTGIRASSDYTGYGKGTKRERQKANNEGPIPGVPVLKEILKPVSDTVGVSLLKKMGWKPGQGVGPRVTSREKKKTRQRNDKKKVYGCSLPNQELKPSESTSESSDDDHEEILFAPDDYEPFRCNPKDNYFGIGYSGLDRTSILGHVNLFEPSTFQLQEKNKKLSIKGQAFGVGAFEADDEDIYARDDMTRYDFSMGPEMQKKNRWSGEGQSSLDSKCLEGFVPAKNYLQSKKYFPPPELPKNFKPIHKVRKSRFSPAIETLTREVAQRKGLARHEMNADDRSVILGEAATSKKPNVTGELTGTQGIVSPVANIITRTLNLHGREQVKERENFAMQQKKSSVSWLDKLSRTNFVRGGIEGSEDTSASLKNLSEFKLNLAGRDSSVEVPKPFAMNDEKQKRFEKYMEFIKSGEKNKLSSIQPLSMTEWEREHESEEFEQAVRLCASSNRTSSSNEVQSSVTETSEDPMVNAARAKMFGKLTRAIEPWQPSSIVCKRFNIPEPKNGCAKPEQKTKKYSLFESLDFCGGDSKFQKATDTAATYKEPHIPYSTKPIPKITQPEQLESSIQMLDTSDIDTTGSKSIEKIRNFEVSYEKVFGKSCEEFSQSEAVEGQVAEGVKTIDKSEKKDLFKAIFLSSSEDEETDGDADEQANNDTVKSLLIGKSINEINIQRNDSPPRGIFAQLDLDELVKPCSSKKINETVVSDKETEKLKCLTVGDDEGVGETGTSSRQLANSVLQSEMKISPQTYGPALPAKSAARVDDSRNPDISQRPVFRSVVIPKLDTGDKSLKWIEKKKAKKDKKKKHKYKEREKKHKHKSKKSKR